MCLPLLCVHTDTSFLTPALTRRSFVLKASLLRSRSVSPFGWTNSQPSVDLVTYPSFHAAWVGLLPSPRCHCLGWVGSSPSAQITAVHWAVFQEQTALKWLRAWSSVHLQQLKHSFTNVLWVSKQLNPFFPCRASVWLVFSSTKGTQNHWTI